MKAKPKGAKYRNLVARGEIIYYARERKGEERIKRSMQTSDWDEAAATRDLWLLRRAQGEADKRLVPTFGELAARYLVEATAHLSGSTGDDRSRVLGPGGPLTRYFGAIRLDAIKRATLLEWWHREVEGKGRSEATGLTDLSALSGVFGHAVDLELLDANPVDALRGTLRRRRRTKRGRATDAQSANVRPIEEPEQLRAFVTASRAAYDRRLMNGRARRERQLGHVADMLMLDGGLRLGETAGLRWRDVVWGGDESRDEARAIAIREAIARGKHQGPPKSGRERTVALSRRLRGLLREFYIASGRPEPTARVLPRFNQGNYRGRHFVAVCTAADLAGHTPKDLRDTFASQLLTAGVQLGWISRQLGHADVATTARHYARWCGGDAYRRPLDVEIGEVPADLLARIENVATSMRPIADGGLRS